MSQERILSRSRRKNEADDEQSSSFVKDGNYYINEEFNESMKRAIVPSLIKDITEKKKLREAKICLFISSYGGYVYVLKEILTLVEAAKACGITVETNVFSHAYSCASLLACAGTVGERYVSPHAEHLIHLGQTGTGEVINDVEAERAYGEITKHFDWVRAQYKKYAKVKDLRKKIHDDNLYFHGQEIIDNGLADNLTYDA